MADEELVVRVCQKCGVEDDEPMHVNYVAFNHPVSGVGVDLSVQKHVKCCGEDGCPICSTDMRTAEKVGADLEHLRPFLQNRPRELQQELFEQFAVESPDFQDTDPREGE
jgi:hypothetical protein